MQKFLKNRNFENFLQKQIFFLNFFVSQNFPYFGSPLSGTTVTVTHGNWIYSHTNNFSFVVCIFVFFCLLNTLPIRKKDILKTHIQDVKIQYKIFKPVPICVEVLYLFDIFFIVVVEIVIVVGGFLFVFGLTSFERTTK